jgi:hypothetical protein
MTPKQALQKILKDIQHIEDENKHSYEGIENIKSQEKSIKIIRK